MTSNVQWSLSDTQKPTSESADQLGNKFLIGNGFVGVRGTLDEYGKAEKVACIPTGIYDQYPGKWREPINLPNPLFLQVTAYGKALHAIDSNIESHVQSLDFQRGVASRQTAFVPDSDPSTSITLKSERFASMAHGNLLCSKVSISATRDVEIELACGVDGDVWDINGPHLAPYRVEVSGDAAALFSSTLEKKIPVVSAVVVSRSGAPLADSKHELHAYKQGKFTLKAGQVETIFLFGYVGYGEDQPRSVAEVQGRLAPLVQHGYDALLAEHEQIWKGLWQVSDVQIHGDEEAQHALRYSLYHLLVIAPYHTRATSIPARGLSGQVYKGAIFWDTEMFMFPFFVHTNPAIAKTLLEYRVTGLPGAQDKARQYGYDGAFYAWESQEGGFDACTEFNVTNVFTGRPTRTFFRDKQIHISGDIPLAFREYARITGDLSLLVEGGAEVIYECARFLLSWSHYKPTKQRYELLDVTGPDEYHERVNNNYYTNVLSAYTIETAIWAYETLEKVDPAAHAKILEQVRRDLAANSRHGGEAIRRTARSEDRCHSAIRPLFHARGRLARGPERAQEAPTRVLRRWRGPGRLDADPEAGRRRAHSEHVRRSLFDAGEARQLEVLRAAHGARLEPERLLVRDRGRGNRRDGFRLPLLHEDRDHRHHRQIQAIRG